MGRLIFIGHFLKWPLVSCQHLLDCSCTCFVHIIYSSNLQPSRVSVKTFLCLPRWFLGELFLMFLALGFQLEVPWVLGSLVYCWGLNSCSCNTINIFELHVHKCVLKMNITNKMNVLETFKLFFPQDSVILEIYIYTGIRSF